MDFAFFVRTFIPKGWLFSCHLITGGYVEDLSLENVLPQIVYCKKISIQKGVAVHLPPYLV